MSNIYNDPSQAPFEYNEEGAAQIRALLNGPIEIEYTDGTKEYLTLPTEEELQAQYDAVENFMKMFADMGMPFEIPEA